MNRDQLSTLTSGPDISLKQGLKKIDETALKSVLIVDRDGRLLGTLSDGDIRRGLLAGKTLEQGVSEVFNPHPITITPQESSPARWKEVLLKNRILLLPVVEDGRLVDAVSWHDAFAGAAEEGEAALDRIDVPVVIMAGGKGTRMAPFTNVLPKPLIPIGEKTIMELIVDQFRKNGVDRFYFTVNYRGEMIRAYFDGLEKDYQVGYVWEKEFLGTAGCLKYLTDVSSTFVVSNCDVLVSADYSDVLAFHRQTGASLTVVSAIQHVTVPYGVIDFKEGGQVTGIVEKPEYTFTVNTGVYVLEPECLQLIPEGQMFHMTHLMEALLSRGKRVSTYPVNEKDYIDIGQWDEYHRSVRQMGADS